MESRISGNVVRKCASAAFVLAAATAAFAAEIDDGIKDGTHGYTPKGYVQPKESEVRERLEWFKDQKLALMMHWGLCSTIGIKESWCLVDKEAKWARREVTWTKDGDEFKRQYWALNRSFNPVRFEPGKWAKTAKDCGFKYVLFTTKHHDGFCLYDSKYTDYKVTSPECPFSTDRRADVVKEVFNAFRAEGLGIAAYFSKPDWHNEDYWEDRGIGRSTTRYPTYDVKADPARWARFRREGAKVKIPDPVIQGLFDYGMYCFGAMTDPDGVPAGLQGPWIEDNWPPPWSGDYHFNINVQECYSPAYRGGHFANMMPLFRMILSWRPILRENARKFAGIDNGYVLPHSVSDRGVNIGGFWTGTIDHGSTAWVADMMWRYVKYSGDMKFLRNGAYDFMKGAMNVYRAMMSEDGKGNLAFPTGPSPEFGGSDFHKAVGRNPSFQLAANEFLVGGNFLFHGQEITIS